MLMSRFPKVSIGGRVRDQASKDHIAKELKGNLDAPDFVDLKTGQMLIKNDGY